MNETPETPTQKGDQLGNFLIASSIVGGFLLCGGLLIGLWQSNTIDEPAPRDAEHQFVDDYDYEDRHYDDRDWDCDIDRSDAEERFARECSE